MRVIVIAGNWPGSLADIVIRRNLSGQRQLVAMGDNAHHA
jgi:hypothetical protein